MTLPLDGVTVVDLTRHLPGPYATMLLGDLGAEVWKIEHPKGGDVARRYPPFTDRGHGAFFATLNRNKKSVTVDLKRDGGSDVFESLLEAADVMLESFRPGVLGRLGHAIESIREAHDDLITCSISGFGQSGSDRTRAGHDLTYAARAGLLDRFRDRRGEYTNNAKPAPPVIPNAQFADVGGGLFAAIRCLAGLFGRERHEDRGSHIDVSLTEAALSLVAPHVTADELGDSDRSNLLGGDRPAYTIYETSDGAHLAVGALEPKFWSAFVDLIERPDLEQEGLASGEAAEEARTEVASIIEQRPLSEWLERFEDVDACVEPVQSIVDALEDELFRGRQAFFEMAGSTHVRTPATPQERGHEEPPSLGAQTDEVLRTVGYSEDEVESLRSSEVI